MKDSELKTNLFMIGNAREGHLDVIQQLERGEWEEESFQHFRDLYNINPEGILVAVDNNGDVLGYVAWILQNAENIEMYPYDFDPREAHKPKGDEPYIAAHGVRKDVRGKGIGSKLIEELKERLSKTGFKKIAFTYNINLGTKWYWDKLGFDPVDGTYDKNWSPIKGKEPTMGAILYECNLIG